MFAAPVRATLAWKFKVWIKVTKRASAIWTEEGLYWQGCWLRDLLKVLSKIASTFNFWTMLQIISTKIWAAHLRELAFSARNCRESRLQWRSNETQMKFILMPRTARAGNFCLMSKIIIGLAWKLIIASKVSFKVNYTHTTTASDKPIVAGRIIDQPGAVWSTTVWIKGLSKRVIAINCRSV